ncbi:Delta(1)-pyrroline-2-carboxylate reductase 1 [Fundidesulfovibrio magnetotacticus]|uniref:Delta(1)-pyrroline-2-carboxylate reductase 1 n=1 Tax=Fundidesulfovibrio magnetotacticus TaxID=2730080 RepID=A0A6V8LQ70_9BACT|nr:delta(1)-pyrroline-2-carboxylate reductase family protein [Fundidesulfovibrio magnetotacticus]GFK92269.1 Delta(1)-pyrroline-2-carboxylate reductase 1 [Fundidesulfovibrio magnetotacticus]
MTLTVHDAAATARLLPWAPLADAVAAVLARKARGLVHAPERLALPLPGGGTLLVMPASDPELAVTKLVSVSPGNPARGLPLIQGEVVALDAATGVRLGVLDGPEVTARRTAAASLLAAQLLAPDPEGPLLVVGAGVQALAHAMAFTAVLGVREVYVAARSLPRAEALADRLRALGAEAQAVASPSAVLERAALVVTATSSPEPVIGEGVRDDVFLAAVGSFQPERAEIPEALVRRCSLFVDDLAAARAEAGDLLRADIDFSRVTPLEAVEARLELSGPVLYKGVGHAALDLAAARLAFPRP